MTHTEKIAAAWGLGLGLVAVVTWLFHWLVVAVWWWPLVGSEWRAHRRQLLEVLAEPFDLNDYVDAPRPGDPEPDDDWDDEPSTDDDADQMIATWHGTDDDADQMIATWHGTDEAEHEQLADVHPIYLDLSDDPDLIVWDAKQQADRCWEIVHIEFPRLRAELAGMWEAAA